jgi:hypothetical protein
MLTTTTRRREFLSWNSQPSSNRLMLYTQWGSDSKTLGPLQKVLVAFEGFVYVQSKLVVDDDADTRVVLGEKSRIRSIVLE